MRIVVVGGGFGAVSAAIRMQAKGHAVTLLEQRTCGELQFAPAPV